MKSGWHSLLRLFLLVAMCLVEAECSTTRRAALGNAARYRGIEVSDDASYEEIFESYQSVLKQYQQKATQETGWKVLSKSPDETAEVAMLPTQSDPSCPYVRMRVTLPVSASRSHQWMSFGNWNRFMRAINPFFDDVKTIQKHRHLAIAQKRTKRIFTFGRRDFGLVSFVEDRPQLENGAYVSATLSLISSRLLPRQPGYTRAFQDMVCFFRPIAEESTELTIMLRTDLNDSAENGTGGVIPMWLVMKTIGTFGSRALQGLGGIVQKELMREEV